MIIVSKDLQKLVSQQQKENTTKKIYFRGYRINHPGYGTNSSISKKT
jgi:hypothetical protein